SDLSLTWPGLRAGPIYLPNPWIVLSSNLLTIVDLQASNLLASQRFLLWQGETSPYRSSVEVRYGASFPLYYAAASRAIRFSWRRSIPRPGWTGRWMPAT